MQKSPSVEYSGLSGSSGPTLGKLKSIEELFAGRHFDREVIISCERWYLRYKLSFRDLVEMMAELGLPIAHTTILRWVRRYAPEFIKRWNRFSRFTGRSWRVDETYIKVRGVWVYLYRAVDKTERTVDFRLSKKRDVGAAKAFFRKAILHEGRPHRPFRFFLLISSVKKVLTIAYMNIVIFIYAGFIEAIQG
jgi:transposase-like protein